MRSLKARLLVGIVVALAAAGTALAYFSSTGSGSGSAHAGTTEAVTIDAGAAPATPLFPGRDGDVTVSISNPNTISIHIPALVLDTGHGTNGFGVDSAHSGCDLSALNFTTQDNSGPGWDVPAKVGTTNGILDLDLADSISMSTDAVNECQGATFAVFLKVSS